MSLTLSESTTPSSQQSQETRLRNKNKAQFKNQLKGATYLVDLTADDGILYADPETVKTAMDSLTTTFQSLTSGGESSATDPRFPKDGFSLEPQSFEPLTHLLNKIVNTANQSTPRSPLSDLYFQHFEGKVNDTFGSYEDLKPDVVGTIGELPTEVNTPAGYDGEKLPLALSWEQVEISVVSKASVRDIVQQSGMCARCCLLNNQRRFFTLGIGFHYKDLEAYIFVFHRSGLSSSRPLRLTTIEGFKGLVNHIVGILSFKDEADYGLDTTRFGSMFCINNRYYETVRHLYVRGTLQGRSTAVYSLQATKDIPRRDLEPRMLMTSGVDHIPDRLTYKQAYQIKGHSQEGPLLAQFYGQLGIVDVIGYLDCGTGDPHGSTFRLLNGAEYWNVYGQEDLPEGRHEPEERGLQCIALSGEGKPLIDLDNIDGDMPSPAELLESILHAIIGHYNLFSGGILHRDISSGNVLRYSEPIQRPALNTFDCTRNVDYCRGFLIDGDHAIKWREFSSSQSISGTIPFMSIRLLSALKLRKTIIHSAVDDLESFLWLLIWVILYSSKDIEGAKAVNPGIEHMLTAWSGDVSMNMSKFTVAHRYWKDVVFGDLIREWLNIFDRVNQENEQITEDMSMMRLGGREWDEACNELDSHGKDIYKEVLESGFKHIKGVREYADWDEVVAANCLRFVGAN